MAEHPRSFVGDRNPAIADTVTIGGVPVDLTAKTVTFKMRAVGSETFKVNAAVSTKEADGDWTYNWGATDLDTAGEYLVCVKVDMGGGALETVNEALIRVQAHAPLENAYVELEEFKSTLQFEWQGHADHDILGALVAASRSLERCYGSRWWTTAAADPDEVRYYSPDSRSLLFTDDIVELTELATADNGGGTFGTVWTLDTDFFLEPLNAATDGEPWRKIRVAGNGSRYFRPAYPKSVRITGRFGWEETPEGVKQATTIIASQVLKRIREAPYGIVSFGGEAMRISRYDSDVERAMQPYNRNVPVG